MKVHGASLEIIDHSSSSYYMGFVELSLKNLMGQETLQMVVCIERNQTQSIFALAGSKSG